MTENNEESEKKETQQEASDRLRNEITDLFINRCPLLAKVGGQPYSIPKTKTEVPSNLCSASEDICVDGYGMVLTAKQSKAGIIGNTEDYCISLLSNCASSAFDRKLCGDTTKRVFKIYSER